MGEGSLSQDEIDALLQGADDNVYDNSEPATGGADFLSPLDRDLLADILNFSFGMAGRTLETLLSKPVKFSNATVEPKQAGDVSEEIGTGGAVALMTNLSGPVNGRASLMLSIENASKIVTVLMGGLSTGALDSAQLQTMK
ncbi:MAG: flagellar motor switch protein FliN, partial [Leptospiraceae bacterium]|nr:flagellar motor switch protein FliN [Leptospiraceae bacterium]